MIRRACLAAVLLLSLSLLASACSGEDDGTTGGGANALGGGSYELTLSSVTNDTCWPQTTQVPPEGAGFVSLLVSASDANVTISPSAAVRFWFQPVQGLREGNDVTLDGNGVLTMGTAANCSISVTNTGTGEVTADDTLDLTLTAELDATTTGTNGCASLEGGDWPNQTAPVIPFPMLTNATDGTCSLTFTGTAVRPD